MHTETLLEEKYKRLLLILKTRNQIIDAQRNIIERQDESHRELMQLLDPPPSQTHYATYNDMENAVAYGRDLAYRSGGCSLEYDTIKERWIQRDPGDE